MFSGRALVTLARALMRALECGGFAPLGHVSLRVSLFRASQYSAAAFFIVSLRPLECLASSARALCASVCDLDRRSHPRCSSFILVLPDDGGIGSFRPPLTRLERWPIRGGTAHADRVILSVGTGLLRDVPSCS